MAKPLSLTAAQGRQLRRLRVVDAFDFESGASPYAFTPDSFHGGRQLVVNAIVCGALQRLGLTDAKVKRGSGRYGGQHTVYWLTPAGRAEADAQLATLGRAS